MIYYGIEYYYPDGGMIYTGGPFTNVFENKKQQFNELEENLRNAGGKVKGVIIKLVSLEQEEYANDTETIEEIKF